MYHQHGAQINDENQSIKFRLGEHLMYIQVGNGYLEVDIRVGKADKTNFVVAKDKTNEFLRLGDNTFAFLIHSARISTLAGTEIEHTNFVGPTSTIMRLITHRWRSMRILCFNRGK